MLNVAQPCLGLRGLGLAALKLRGLHGWFHGPSPVRTSNSVKPLLNSHETPKAARSKDSTTTLDVHKSGWPHNGDPTKSLHFHSAGNS